MNSWMQTELDHLSVGDRRRKERFESIVQTFVAHPNASVAQATNSWYETKATYNFWSSPHVSPSQLTEAIGRGAVERARAHETILCLQDTTNICFASSGASGLGYLDHGRGKGIMAHSSFLVSPAGVPVGVLDQHLWVRPPQQMGKAKRRSQRPIEEKESYRWIQGLEGAQRQLEGTCRVVSIADRESDIFELLATPRPAHSEWLIRACHNRRLVKGGTLWESIREAPVGERLSITLQKADERPARQAELTLQWASARLAVPSQLATSDLMPITVQALLVEEPDPPPGAEPVCWKLLTTLPIHRPEQALTYVRWYSHRWLIERFHYVLKSGCGVEELQLREHEALKKALITFSLVAYRLMWLIYQSRIHPQTPCNHLLDRHEWQALYSHHHESFAPPDYIPTLQQAVRWIAMLGGYLGRSCDGPPGVKNLWRGMRRLKDIAHMWLVFTKGSYQQY